MSLCSDTECMYNSNRTFTAKNGKTYTWKSRNFSLRVIYHYILLVLGWILIHFLALLRRIGQSYCQISFRPLSNQQEKWITWANKRLGGYYRWDHRWVYLLYTCVRSRCLRRNQWVLSWSRSCVGRKRVSEFHLRARDKTECSTQLGTMIMIISWDLRTWLASSNCHAAIPIILMDASSCI